MKDKELIEYIKQWHGSVSTEVDSEMRKKMYECHGNFLIKLTKEISSIVNKKENDGNKVVSIKTLLAKNNLYAE